MRPDDHIQVLQMIEAAETAIGFVSGREPDILWKTATIELPALLPLLQALIREE